MSLQSFRKIGFIKGGQLARMMIQELISLDMGFRVSVLDDDANCPCVNLCENFVIGDSRNFDDVLDFGKNLDLVILEFEDVNLEALQELENQGVKVACSAQQLALIQDKGVQKQFMLEHEIATAEFVLVENEADFLKKSWCFPFVQKLRRSGYDGSGVQVINSMEEMGGFFDQASLIEKKVDFAKEFSVIVCRDVFGKTDFYPIVEQEFHTEKALVQLMIAPSGLNESVKNQALEIADKLSKSFDQAGMWALEMFLTRDGQVLLNEISPRVHNSGHFSMDACFTGQFAQFLRIALGLPLGSMAMRESFAATYNLLGDPHYKGEVLVEGLDEILKIEGVFPHLYGKKETRPYRKIGHVNLLANSRAELEEKIQFVKSKLRVVAR
jgi:5-(carboxyamino)imidazole ribonucleotide synthase